MPPGRRIEERYKETIKPDEIWKFHVRGSTLRFLRGEHGFRKSDNLTFRLSVIGRLNELGAIDHRRHILFAHL